MLGALGRFGQNAMALEKENVRNAYNTMQHPIQYAQQQFGNAMNRKRAPQDGIGDLGSFAPQIGPF